MCDVINLNVINLNAIGLGACVTCDFDDDILRCTPIPIATLNLNFDGKNFYDFQSL